MRLAKLCKAFVTNADFRFLFAEVSVLSASLLRRFDEDEEDDITERVE